MKGFLNSGSGGASPKGATMDTLIGRQTEILGDVRFTGGLHVDGKVKGMVTAVGDKSATLSVSETGAIEGDVRVPNIMLNGSVTGDVHASEKLSLAAKAKVIGDVYYRLLQMEPGAQVNGQVLFQGSEGAAPQAQPRPGDARLESSVVELQDGRRLKGG